MKLTAKEAALGLPNGQLGVIQRRLTDEHELDIFLVREPITDQFALELRGLPNGIQLPSVDVGDIIDIELHRDNHVVRLKLLADGYLDVFLVLIDDLVDTIVANPGLESGSRAVMLRLRRWEKLLESSSQGLSISAQKGLFGELHVLQRLTSKIGIERAIHAWKGPEGGIRDFDLGGAAIEVKTTAGRGLLTVRISSEHQLENALVNPLLLWCNAIEKIVNGKSLNDVVEEVRDLLSGYEELCDLYQIKLLAVGYSTSDRHRYTSSFLVREEFIYRIEQDFPRIVSSDLMDCVFNVTYSVDLEACTAWRHEADSLLDSLIDLP
jgi:Putative  PD-(D/E)XK family member, (DUF4420)